MFLWLPDPVGHEYLTVIMHYAIPDQVPGPLLTLDLES
jgi:hypothetical protein